MNEIIPAWSPYEGRTCYVSSGRKTLTSAFADLVLCRSGFPPTELPEIFAAAEDEAENDAARDLVRLDAELLARMFAMGRIGTAARPLGGGEVSAIAIDLWEVDDPLPRFATGALNLERWWDPKAPLTHRIFVDTKQFDRWLAALQPPGFLSERQIEEIVDPQLRAARATAGEGVRREGDESAASDDRHVDPVDPPGVGPLLLSIKEVRDLIKKSESTIYAGRKKGTFPEGFLLGSSRRWKKTEILAWIEQQAAKGDGS